MDLNIVVDAACLVGRVVVGQPDVRSGLAGVFVNASDPEPWREDDPSDAGPECLWTCIRHVIVLVLMITWAGPNLVVH